jgi:hypothetical protein
VIVSNPTVLSGKLRRFCVCADAAAVTVVAAVFSPAASVVVNVSVAQFQTPTLSPLLRQ